MEEKLQRMTEAVSKAKLGMDKMKKLLKKEVEKRNEAVKAKDAEILSLRERVSLLEAQLQKAASGCLEQSMVVHEESESSSSSDEDESSEEEFVAEDESLGEDNEEVGSDTEKGNGIDVSPSVQQEGDTPISSTGAAEAEAHIAVRVISSKKPDEERLRMALLDVKESPAGCVHKKTMKRVVDTVGSCSPHKIAHVFLDEISKSHGESSFGSEESSSSQSRSRVMPNDMLKRLEKALSVLIAVSGSTVQLAFTEMPPPSVAVTGDNRVRKSKSWKRPLQAAKIPGYLHVQEVLDCLQRRLRCHWESCLSSDVPLFAKTMLGGTHAAATPRKNGSGGIIDSGRLELMLGSLYPAPTQTDNASQSLLTGIGAASALQVLASLHLGHTRALADFLYAVALQHISACVTKGGGRPGMSEDGERQDGRPGLPSPPAQSIPWLWALAGLVVALDGAMHVSDGEVVLPAYTGSHRSSDTCSLKVYTGPAFTSSRERYLHLCGIHAAHMTSLMLRVHMTSSCPFVVEFTGQVLGYLGDKGIPAGSMVSTIPATVSEKKTELETEIGLFLCYRQQGFLPALLAGLGPCPCPTSSTRHAESLSSLSKVMLDTPPAHSGAHIVLCRLLGPCTNQERVIGAPTTEDRAGEDGYGSDPHPYKALSALFGSPQDPTRVGASRSRPHSACITSLDSLIMSTYESRWGVLLRRTSSNGVDTDMGGCVTAFNQWRVLLHAFSAADYGPEGLRGGVYTRARDPYRPGDVSALKYGWSFLLRGGPEMRYCGEVDVAEGKELEGQAGQEEQEEQEDFGEAPHQSKCESRPLDKVLRQQLHGMQQCLRRSGLSRPSSNHMNKADEGPAGTVALDSDSDDGVPPPPPPPPHSSSSSQTDTEPKQESRKLPTAGKPLTLPHAIRYSVTDQTSVLARALGYSSVSSGVFADAVHTWHIAASLLRDDGDEISGKLRRDLEARTTNLSCAIGAALVEVLYTLLACSACGCMRACIAYARERGWCHPFSADGGTQRQAKASLLKVLSAALSFHESCPAPWSTPACAATAQIVYEATQVEMALLASAPPSDPVAPSSIQVQEDDTRAAKKARISAGESFDDRRTDILYRHKRNPVQQILSYGTRLPCLVLNLRRRQDRRVKILRDLGSVGLSLAMLKAIDASKAHGNIVTTGDEGPSAGTGTDGMGKVPLLERLMMELQDEDRGSNDGYDEGSLNINKLSDSFVCHTWDSHVNHEFDPTCLVDSETPMSATERACAASHLMAWLLLQRLRCARVGKDAAPGASTSNKASQRASIDQTCHLLAHSFGWARWGGGWTAPGLSPRDSHRTPRVSSSSSSSSSSCEESVSEIEVDDWYLILEDDASVVPEFREETRFRKRLAQILAKIPPDWDILYLGHAASGKGKGQTVGGGLFYRPLYVWQLHGYILRGTALGKLASSLPIAAPVDNHVANLIYTGRLVAYTLQRQLIIQEGDLQYRMRDSDIEHSGRVSAVTGEGRFGRVSWSSQAH
jgi:hypothetical protein